MRTRLTTRLGFAAVALTFAAAAPTFAATHKRSAHQGGGSSASAADHSADQLNAQSLQAIQQGQTYTPSGAMGGGAGGSMGGGAGGSMGEGAGGGMGGSEGSGSMGGGSRGGNM